MQEVKSHEQSIISFRQITNSQLSRTNVFRVGISHVITSITAQPATIFFVLFSLVLGSAIAFIVPPLRGPDEIAHFVRIYSYVNGELLPSAELDGRDAPAAGITSRSRGVHSRSDERPSNKRWTRRYWPVSKPKRVPIIMVHSQNV